MTESYQMRTNLDNYNASQIKIRLQVVSTDYNFWTGNIYLFIYLFIYIYK